MNNSPVKITRKQAAPLLQASFPEYRGRKIVVKFTDKVWLHDLNASGGSHNRYVALRADFTSVRVPEPAPWVNVLEGAEITMAPAFLMIEHTMFCGQDCGITVYAHPSLAPKLLSGGE